MNEIHVNGATLLMPNYILSRTSPPAHIYERKINLGYGIKVDTSDAPTQASEAGKAATQPPEPNKGKKMEDAKTVLGVADKPVATFADGNAGLIRAAIKVKEAKEAEGLSVQTD